MIDCRGNTVNVGDKVVVIIPHYRDLEIATVTKITNAGVTVVLPNNKCRYRASSQICKLEVHKQ